MEEIRVFQHSFQSFQPEESPEKKKRQRPADCFFLFRKEKMEEKRQSHANCFFLFRQEKMKERPPEMTMTDYSKKVSEMWQNLSEDEKTVWKRKYEINRDNNLNERVNSDQK